MSQADYTIADQDGASFLVEINNQLAAIVSNNSGATEPTTTYAYQWWADTSSGLLKQRNAANSAWVTIGTLASTNLGLLALAGGTLTGALNEAQGADISSAATVNLTTATGNYVHITGTTTITAITLAQGAERTVVFDGALTLTNGASLLLPTSANITTAAGDTAIFRGEAAGVVRCVSYTRKNGTAVNFLEFTTQNATGTSIDFTGIESWAKFIIINFSSLSTNGISNPIVQIGDSGGIETTGYVGGGSNITSSITSANSTQGFLLCGGWAATILLSGCVTLTRHDPNSNIWTASFTGGRTDVGGTHVGGGAKALTGILDRVRITTANGTDAFDNGSISCYYG